MKKKIVFMLINMNIGGTEKALINMITEMPKNKYEITIILLEEVGAFLQYIPQNVKVKYLTEYQDIKNILNKPPKVWLSDLVRHGRIDSAFCTYFFYILSKIFGNKSLFFKFILHKYPTINDEYDVAVAYAGPMDFISYFVVHKIRANKKIQWIHFDISKIGFNKRFAAKIYKKFNKIFVVSAEGKNKLIQCLPSMEDRTEKFLNILSPDLIVHMAKQAGGFNDHFDGVRILTVGRLSHEKGQDLTITVLAKLREEGYNVRWYCIGEGNARNQYERLIKHYCLENEYLLLGATPNPYPYMQQCDIYVQPSRHEGYCITLSEAKCFTNPIISTNFTGAKEQLSHRKTGLIVDFDFENLYQAVKQLLDNQELRNQIKINLEKEIVGTTREMDKLYELVEGI